MSDIKFQLLTTTKELEKYQMLTAEKVGVELPMSYLSKARVLGLKAKDSNVICGGFTIASEGPLRCLSQIPGQAYEKSPILKRFKNQFFEINGMWLNRALAPENSRLQLYLHCMREASRQTLQGKSKYVYAYCAENQKLRAFYENFNSVEIYEGPVELLPGMKEAGRERVEMGCMKKLPLTILRNPLFLLKRAKLVPQRPLVASVKRISKIKEGWL